MAPNTAVGLLMIGLGLLAFDVEKTRRGTRPAQWFALVTAFLSSCSRWLGTRVMREAELIGINTYIPMALNSAATLGLLALSLLLATPDRGLMSVVSKRETGKRHGPPTAAGVNHCSGGVCVGWRRPVLGAGLFRKRRLVFRAVSAVDHRVFHLPDLVERRLTESHGCRAIAGSEGIESQRSNSDIRLEQHGGRCRRGGQGRSLPDF